MTGMKYSIFVKFIAILLTAVSLVDSPRTTWPIVAVGSSSTRVFQSPRSFHCPSKGTIAIESQASVTS